MKVSGCVIEGHVQQHSSRIRVIICLMYNKNLRAILL